MDLRHYVQVLLRNWVLIAAAVVVSVVTAVLHDARQPDVYEAEAQLLLLPENVVEGNALGAAEVDPPRYATAQLALITSRGLAEQAASVLEGVTPDTVLANVSAVVDESSTIITVRGTSRHPEQAALVVNAVVDSYVEDRVQASTGRLTDAIEEIEERLAALATTLPASDDEVVTAAELAAQQQYQTLFARQQDLQVQLSLQRNTVEVLERAQVPVAPLGLGLPSKVVLAVLLGIVLGLAAVYAREQFDDRVRSREEVQALTGLPVLAELPVERRRRDHATSIATVDRPTDRLAEAIRSLRTSIGFLSIDRPVHRLAVTSAMPGEGKTLVVSNLGAASARAGRRTVIVSADLRRPTVEQLFGLEGATGLSDAFTAAAQRADIDERAAADAVRRLHGVAPADSIVLEHVRETDVDDLFLLPAGTPVPNPSELLSSAHMDDVLEVLSREFDMVIVDTSPVLSVADAAAVATKVGDVLIVASMPQTRRRSLARTVEAVEATHARVLGIALNRVSVKAASYGGYYDGRYVESGHVEADQDGEGRVRSSWPLAANRTPRSRAVNDQS